VLVEIERKLSSVEGAQVHLENTAVRDGEIIVCGKKIMCDPTASLSVGPVLGIVSQTSARVLVECSRMTLLTVNVFLSDELSATARFLYNIDVCATAGQPCACTLTGLSPGCKYVVYIGGVAASETLCKPSQFVTLPQEGPQMRTLFVHNDSPVASTSREVDSWAGLQTRCLTEKETPHMIFHLGGFVSLDEILRQRGLQLFELASRDDVDDSALRSTLLM